MGMEIGESIMIAALAREDIDYIVVNSQPLADRTPTSGRFCSVRSERFCRSKDAKPHCHCRIKNEKTRQCQNSSSLAAVLAAICLAASIFLETVDGFTPPMLGHSLTTLARTSVEHYFVGNGNAKKGSKIFSVDDDSYRETTGNPHEEFDDFGEEDFERPGVLIEDLNWRVEKLRLEEANTRRFLKAKPRFLPYEECRKWVMAFGRWRTEEDWRDWISMGEKRNSYIPSRPDEYYGRLGQWISWDHFLGVSGDENT